MRPGLSRGSAGTGCYTARDLRGGDMTFLFAVLLAWLALAAVLLFAWRGHLLALWREPAFRAPILIVESDDWGAGPLAQADALAALAAGLSRHHDAEGRPARMTLGLILASPNPGMVGRVTLADIAQRPILEAVLAGRGQGVFAPQLHGMEHFWPDAVRAAAREQPEVRAWLAAPDLAERLPSPLQSRWTDASRLPSRPHDRLAVEIAVAEETTLYARLFGAPPEVVVPPTFVWTRDVEAAWAAAGVRVIVTPGRRLTARDGAGKPAGVDRDMRNGERGEGDVLYLVRDDYFEPVFGHRPDQALAALARKTALARPCLLETHRSNFLAAAGGDPAAALAALDELYTRALRDFPALRFASCAELGRAIRTGDPAWIEQERRRRFTIWLRRAAVLPRFGKAARRSGLLPLLNLFARSDRHP
jgi:hypothetical protein